MFSLKVVLFFLLALLITIQAAPPTRPPPHACQYTCPREDNGRNFLESSNGRGDTLICTYRGHGRNRNGSCIYGRFTGRLLRDNDRGQCPRQAGNTNHCGRDGHHKRDGETTDDDVDDSLDTDDVGDDQDDV